MKRSILTTLLVVVITSIYSQKGIHKFGNIPMDEMEMTVYEPDSSAIAVKLLKTGKYLVKDYKFYVHERIKILKTAGTDYANFVINAPNKGVFKASTFNLEDGEIVEYKLKRSEIFEEEITDDLVVYKLYLPNVKVGSVVEIEYSHPSLPNEWKFQENIPIKYNELLVQKSQYYIFDIIHYGSEALNPYGGYHWSRRDMPAFKPEPRMDNPDNYIRKVEFQFSEISIPGQLYKKFSTSWEKVAETLNSDPSFGGMVEKGTGYLNDKVKELDAKELSDKEKVMEAYEYMRESMEWNGDDGIFVGLGYRKHFKEDHSGSVADINLSLVSLLRKIGITAYPVVFSTKDNGRLNKYKASLNKLNYVICYVELGEEKLLLDATAKDLSPGTLAPRCLNGQGYLIGNENFNSHWIDLTPKNVTLERSFAQIELLEDGTCNANILKSLTQYNYLDWKEKYDKYDDESKYVRSLESELDYPYIENYSSKIDESNMKVTEKYKVDLTDRLEDFGDEIIINPFLFSTDITNPFKAEERISSVDLKYKSAIVRTIMIKIPESMKLEKGIQPLTVTTDDEKAQFAFTFNSSEGQISISYQIVFASPTIFPRDYQPFKTFYSLMIDKLNESLTLQRL